MGIEALRKKLAEILERMEALSNSVVNEKGEIRSLNDEENAEYSRLDAERAQISEAIERLVKIEEQRAAVRKLDERGAVHIPKVVVGREHNCNDEGDYRGFASLGEQLQAVRQSCTPGKPIDARLNELQQVIQKRGASGPGGLNEGQGAEGGFFVQSDFAVDLTKRTYEKGVLASKCTHTPISAASNRITRLVLDENSRVDGSRWGGVQAYWRDEAATVSPTKPKYALQSLDLKSLMAFYIATDEILADATALQADVNRLVPQELAFKLDDSVLRGVGVGQPQGILTAAARIQISKESGQTAATVNSTNVRKMNQRLYVPSDPNAEWYINQFVEDQLLGMYIAGSHTDFFPYIPAGGIAGRPYATLFGKPVRKIEHASALGTLGDICLLDLSQYELIEKGGVDAANSMHVYFLYAEQVFRFMLRTNGAPLWPSAMTPYKGSDTVSPFIALQTRS